MRIVVRVSAVLGLLFGLSWTAANACILPAEPPPGAVPFEPPPGAVPSERPLTELDAGAALLLGLAAFAATRRPVVHRVPSSPG